ncbi:MAG: hypothetical protein Q9180_008827 [Flavoplaca navasiana]
MHVYSNAPQAKETKEMEKPVSALPPSHLEEKKAAGLYFGGKRNPKLYAAFAKQTGDSASASPSPCTSIGTGSDRGSQKESLSSRTASTLQSAWSSLSSFKSKFSFSTTTSKASPKTSTIQISRPVAGQENQIRELKPGEAQPLLEELANEKMKTLQSKVLPAYHGEDADKIDAFRKEVESDIEKNGPSIAARKMGIYNKIEASKSGAMKTVDAWKDSDIQELHGELGVQLDMLIHDFDKGLNKKCFNFLKTYHADKIGDKKASDFDFLASDGVYEYIKSISPEAANKFMAERMDQKFGLDRPAEESLKMKLNLELPK